MGLLARFGRLLVRADAGSAYTTTGTGRRSLGWRPPSYGPNAALDYSLTNLRNQSRELVRKNALAGSAVERVVSNVVGTGIKPKLTNEGLAKLWKTWTDQSAADGQLDFYGQQQQVMRAVVESGECFVRLRNRLPVDGLAVPLQLEVLEPEFVPVQWNMTASSGGEIRQGVEFDPILRSKRVAYWIYQRHPNDGGTVAVDMRPVRVPASEILHIYWPGRPGQVRGEPWFARVLDRLADLEAYDKAELVRKKTAAMFVAFVSGSLPDGLSLEDIAQIYGDGDPNDPASQTKIENGVGQATVEPGTILYGKPGENLTFAAPSDVGANYEAFLRSHKRDIAAALGLLYEQLTGDYGNLNDRTWRAAVTEFRRRCEGWQHHLVVFQMCRPVFARWSDMALVAGAVTGRDLKAAAAPDWTPPAWPYINPLQDVQAREAEVRAGFRSRMAIVSEGGEDVAQVDAEQAADNARADKLGLAHDSDGRRSAKGAVAAEGPARAGEGGGAPPSDQPKDGPQPQPGPTAALGRDEGQDHFAEEVHRNFKAIRSAVEAIAEDKHRAVEGPVGVVLNAEQVADAARKAAREATMAPMIGTPETYDNAGRILTMLFTPKEGTGPVMRRTFAYDAVTGRLKGSDDAPVEVTL